MRIMRAEDKRWFCSKCGFPLAAPCVWYADLLQPQIEKQHQGNLSFLAAFLNAYAIFTFFNLFDLLVLDYLVMIGLQPDFVVLPGTEGMASYHDYFFPFIGFLKGLGIGLIPSLLIAFFTSHKWKRRHGEARGQNSR